jgi:ElaA protein
MTKEVKPFDSLSLQELYKILQLRSAVFVVEQQCAYQDPDGKDHSALHVLGQDGDDLLAYSRIFAPGTYYKEACIGRVTVHKKARSRGLGKEIMRFSIGVVEERFGSAPIALSAQSYLREFYAEMGFMAEGKEYLEDGIPHVRMVRK